MHSSIHSSLPRSARPPAGPADAARGFTLVELVIVILLVSLLSFTAQPRLIESDDAPAQGFAEPGAEDGDSAAARGVREHRRRSLPRASLH
jgi:prepilin-type N-terminal cleavage/methylation domain-containing protein